MICENCDKCICNKYPQLIRPIDTTHRPILVIGESVTAIEARRGECMTGHGAEILKQTLVKVGLPCDQQSVKFTTAISCAFPKKKGLKLPKEAILNCRTRLLREIREINPKMILVCGSVALQTLIGETNIKITSEYGVPRKYDYCGDATVIPIMNPGLILHSPGDFKPFLAMLQLAATIYKGGTQHSLGEVTWTVLDTVDKCRDAWKHLMLLYEEGELPWVTCDIETTGLDYRVAEFLVLGIRYVKNKVYVLPREMKDHMHNFVDGVPWKTIWHHGKYDKKIAWKRNLATVNIDGDTMYMHYVLDETSAHDLEYLSKVFLQAEAYKYKMNQNWKAVNLESYPAFFEALCERVAVDCDYTGQLVEVLEKELQKEPTLAKLYNDFLIPAANFLSRVEQNGMLVDPFFLEESNEKYQLLLDHILNEVQSLAAPYWDRELYMEQTQHKTAPVKFNPGAPDQMAWMLFDRLKIKPRIKKGRSTDKDILKSIDLIERMNKKEITYDQLPEHYRIIAKVLEYRSVQKEKSTYVEGLLDARDDDGRVRSTFSLHITATGRLSSKEPNVQNQPSANGVAKAIPKQILERLGITGIGKIRRAFIPRKGYVLGEIDYSGAELRWLAFMSKCPVLMDVFLSGRNLHNETATALFGPNYDKAQKLRAKAVNFGIPYGRESQSFVDEFDITKEEAEAMIRGWLDKYHGARDYLQWCADQVVLGNYLETPFGRRRRFGLVTPESLHALQNEARNFPIQSPSSDTLLAAAMDLEKPLAQHYDTHILNLVHDSMVLEIPKDPYIISKVGLYANKVMINKPIELFDCPVPFKTDFEIGPDWESLMSFNCHTLKLEKEVGDEIIEYNFHDWVNENYHWDVYEKLGM
jgi:uracil-DNA glycosylase family 4